MPCTLTCGRQSRNSHSPAIHLMMKRVTLSRAVGQRVNHLVKAISLALIRRSLDRTVRAASLLLMSQEQARVTQTASLAVKALAQAMTPPKVRSRSRVSRVAMVTTTTSLRSTRVALKSRSWPSDLMTQKCGKPSTMQSRRDSAVVRV